MSNYYAQLLFHICSIEHTNVLSVLKKLNYEKFFVKGQAADYPAGAMRYRHTNTFDYILLS